MERRRKIVLQSEEPTAIGWDGPLGARKFYGRRRRFLGEHVLDCDQVFRPKGHAGRGRIL